jgi:hypothetical protein
MRYQEEREIGGIRYHCLDCALRASFSQRLPPAAGADVHACEKNTEAHPHRDTAADGLTAKIQLLHLDLPERKISLQLHILMNFVQKSNTISKLL